MELCIPPFSRFRPSGKLIPEPRLEYLLGVGNLCISNSSSVYRPLPGVFTPYNWSEKFPSGGW